jgi:hypothetical protein
MGSKMKRVGLFLAALVSLAPTAYADWQFTKWGMTPEQVIAASGGSAVTPDAEKSKSCSSPSGEDKCLAIMPSYKVGSYKFEVSFQFSERKLNRILLKVDPKEYPNVREMLLGVYGEPISDKKTSFSSKAIWKDDRNKNSVSLNWMPDTYLTIYYEPIVTGL